MCFGSKETGSKTESPSPWLASGAQFNMDYAQNLASTPFSPYQGERVADFSPDQLQAFGQVRDLAGSQNPWLGAAAGAYQQYGSTPAGSVTPASILGGNIDPSKGIADYMDPYLGQVIDTTMGEIRRGGEIARTGAGGINSAATAHGAIPGGDDRLALELSEQRRNQGDLEARTTAQLLSQGFNAAAGLRGIDVGNLRAAETANAGLNEQFLSRVLGGGNALTGLDQYQTGRGINLAQALAGTGAAQQGQEQQKLNVPYSDWLMAYEDAYRKLAGLNQTQAASATGSTKTTTAAAPDNSGWGLAGTLGGAAIGALSKAPFLAMLSDRRMKENIERVGALDDGLPVYAFNYKGDDTPRIGLMAQDVEKEIPEAVRSIVGDMKVVDMRRATARAAAMRKAA